MSLTRLHAVVISGWLTAVAGLLGVPLVLGMPPTPADSVAIVLLGCLPVMIQLAVFRGAPSRRVAHVLYDTQQHASERVGVRSHANPSGAARQ